MKKNIALHALIFALGIYGLAASAGTNTHLHKPVPAGYTVIPSKANGSGVRVLFKGAPQGKEKQKINVTILLDSIIASNGAAASFSSDEGLVIAQNPGTISLQHNESKTVTLSVHADQPGLYYVNVFTKQNSQNSAASIPVKIGHGQLRNKPTVTASPDGQNVISMPSK